MSKTCARTKQHSVQHFVQSLPPDLQNCVFQYDTNASPLESFLIVYFPFNLTESGHGYKVFQAIWKSLNLSKSPLDVKEKHMPNFLEHEIECGNLATVHFLNSLHANGLKSVWNLNSPGMDLASEYGHLPMVKYLHSLGQKCTTNAMDFASKNGHLEVVKFLHCVGKDCTTYAMDWASLNGHVEVVKYLMSIEKNCKQFMIDWARGYDKWEAVKECVQYLRPAGQICSCLVNAQVWLTDNKNNKPFSQQLTDVTCPVDKILHVRSKGHLAIVEYLYAELAFTCTE